ncbi:hypothetical protein ILUMI_02176 [Ignelater luminosus]|uniref:glutathione transferase n=1 Tax=Ignelater luminosus TaxID=2038154 RepID=A0A8K0GGQ3_IGNLU|nr:hypothetical protein ILUMI_02176 [Ignelater luminosus]
MAPAYKLTYFPISGLAEPLRYLMSYGGIEFEDYRFERENWPNLKPNMPFGQVPVLEVNGKLAHQHVAMARYLAKQVKLVGKDDWEDLEIDAIVETINDLRQKIFFYYYEQHLESRRSQKELFFRETLPYYLERLDAIAKNNNGHLAVGKLTWADVFFVSFIEYFNFLLNQEVIANYPNLQLVEKNVVELPAIKNWLERRPQNIWENWRG